MHKLLNRMVRATLGLMLFAFGVYLTIQANIGLAPWDCLSIGLSGHIPLSYGTLSIIISVAIVGVDLLLGEPIGVGTLLDAVVCGASVDLYTALGFVPKLHNLWLGFGSMATGLFIMAFGQYIYMSAGLCCGPRDSMLVGIGKRLRRCPIGFVNILILAVVLVIGALLGGKVGVGTVVSVAGIGLAMQLVFRLLRFEPRDVRHENLFQSLATVRRGLRRRQA